MTLKINRITSIVLLSALISMGLAFNQPRVSGGDISAKAPISSIQTLSITRITEIKVLQEPSFFSFSVKAGLAEASKGCAYNGSAMSNLVQNTAEPGLLSQPAGCFRLKPGAVAAAARLMVQPLREPPASVKVAVFPSMLKKFSLKPLLPQTGESLPAMTVAVFVVVAGGLTARVGGRPRGIAEEIRYFAGTPSLQQLQIMRC